MSFNFAVMKPDVKTRRVKSSFMIYITTVKNVHRLTRSLLLEGHINVMTLLSLSMTLSEYQC